MSIIAMAIISLFVLSVTNSRFKYRKLSYKYRKKLEDITNFAADHVTVEMFQKIHEEDVTLKQVLLSEKSNTQHKINTTIQAGKHEAVKMDILKDKLLAEKSQLEQATKILESERLKHIAAMKRWDVEMQQHTDALNLKFTNLRKARDIEENKKQYEASVKLDDIMKNIYHMMNIEDRLTVDNILDKYDKLEHSINDAEHELQTISGINEKLVGRNLLDEVSKLLAQTSTLEHIVDISARNLDKLKRDADRYQDTIKRVEGLDNDMSTLTEQVDQLNKTKSQIISGTSNDLFNNVFKNNNVNYLVMLQYAYYSGVVSNAGKSLTNGKYISNDNNFRNALKLDKFSIMAIYSKLSENFQKYEEFDTAIKVIDNTILKDSYRDYLINLLQDIKDKPSDVKTYIINEAIGDLSKHVHKLKDKYS